MSKKNTVSEIFENFFKQKNMIFYRRDVAWDIVTFILPYSITKQNLRFDIELVAFDDNDTCTMGFSKELNEEVDYSSELLDMNAALAHGKLSVEKNSNQVTYILRCSNIQDDAIAEAKYDDMLKLCLGVLARLYSKHIIK